MEHADGDASRAALAPGRDAPDAVSHGGGRRSEGAGHISASVHEGIGTGYAFFPGCQIGAGAPDLVLDTYSAVRELDPEVGMLLMCCGAPAEWAGDTERHAEALALIRGDWEAIGSPTLLTACPTCARELREYMPDAATVSVYEWLAERMSVPPAPPVSTDTKMSVPAVYPSDKPSHRPVSAGIPHINIKS
jgi:hypothetical protein